MPRIFRQKDIESMKESDLSQEFVDYFNRMSDERKLLFSQDRPDLYAAVLSWKDTAEKFNGNHLDEVDLTELGVDEETQSRTVRDTLRENDPDSALDAIMHNAYDNVDIPQIIKDDFRPVEALVIDDDRTKCPVHRVPLKEYNPRFHNPDGSIFGMMLYHCPDCNRLFIKKSRLERNENKLREWNVPFKFYDYDTSKKYLATQIKPYVLDNDEKIYVPEQWIEENPKCPIHDCALEELPCLREYGGKSISFDAYWCEECKKVVMRRTQALKLQDQCAETGVPLVGHETLVKKTPPKPTIPKREIKPDYYMDEGKRSRYSFDRIADCYKLEETDIVVVSDSPFCTLAGHETETVLGLIWVKERAGGNRKSYLFMLGYCSECQKYFMDEADYKAVYSIGRPEVTLLLDLTDNSPYMITSGEVFDLEKNHLGSVEKGIENEVNRIENQPDYISPYATISGYDDGDLAYRKTVSERKYKSRLTELYGFRECPYRYRVDITANGKTEVYYIGSADITLNNRVQVISASSKFGRELVNYKTIKVKKGGVEHSIKLSREFDIKDSALFGYANLRTDEDIVFRRGVTDPFLIRVLNMRKRQHNLIDIFVTIQENQNSIVDAGFEKNLIVQGCAGSGKTMVLLHRLSSLKYNRPDFDFSREAIILTPNDNFTIHIKGLAESLQIGSINRASVERYYKNALEEYSKDFRVSGPISSEMSVTQKFVDYIYSDGFRSSFEKCYLQIIGTRNKCISELDRIIELMGEKPREIDVSNDSGVIPQLTMVLDALSSKIDASERKVNDAATTLKDTQERKDRVPAEKAQRQASAEKILRDAASRAKAKALAALLEKQQTLDETQENIRLLNSEKEKLEKDIESLAGEDNPLLPGYELTNSAWIDSDISDKLHSLSLMQSEINALLTEQEYLAAVISTPLEKYLSSRSSDDADIARILLDLTNEQSLLKIQLLNKSQIENGRRIGRARRLAAVSKKIEESEDTIEKYKSSIREVLDSRKREYAAVSDNIERLNSEMLSVSDEIKRAVEQKRKKRISALKRQISRQTNNTESELDLLNKHVEIVNQISDEMKDTEIITWLNQIRGFVPSVDDEIRLYSRFQKEIAQLEELYSELDDRIAAAQQAYESALSSRYSAEIQNAVKELKQKLDRFSILDTYQMIFDETVQPFKEKNGINAIAGRNHRYDFYSQLIFAMKFFGRKPRRIKFMCVDEGQDLALNEYRLLYELNEYDVIFNIFGDTNQLIKPNRGISDWTELKSMFKADYYTLNENYRNTNQITRFCNESFNMNMLQTGVDGAKIREINRKEFEQELSKISITTDRVAILIPRSLRKRQYLDLAAPRSEVSEEIVEGKIAVMYVDEVKGIEFDKAYVILNRMGRNEKYIAYSRALSELVIVIDESIPE